ncbi:hypothetical protein TNCV_2764231 [Trichonephila clavipes]|nr:hypothetical protein TNCV_2764231 [Trichonephila clavipes]
MWQTRRRCSFCQVIGSNPCATGDLLSATLVFGYHFDKAKKRILTHDKIDRHMNNSDELSEDGLEYSDDDVDFLPHCVSSNKNWDSDCENSVGSQNTIQNVKNKSDDDNKLDGNISVREPFLNLTFKNNKTLSKNILWKTQSI